MSSSTLPVVAVIAALPEKRQELADLLQSLIEPTRQEEGCLRYELFEDQEDASIFVFIEEWTDLPALQAHLQTPHLQRLISRLNELTRGVQIHQLRQLG